MEGNMEAELKFVIPALLGVESLVAREVKKLGLAEVRAENGRGACAPAAWGTSPG